MSNGVISHAIFDMDGLLLDTEILYTKNTQQLLAPYNKEFKYEWKVQLMGRKPLESAKLLVELAEIDMSPEEFSKKLYDSLREDFKTCNLMPGVLNVLNELKSRQCQMCIATSSDQEGFNIKTSNHSQMLEYFSHFVCGGSDPNVKKGKPNPDIFLEAMRVWMELGLKPENCVVFEDARNGVEAALAAGMKVVWVPAPGTDRSGVPDTVLVLDSLEQFHWDLLTA